MLGTIIVRSLSGRNSWISGDRIRVHVGLLTLMFLVSCTPPNVHYRSSFESSPDRVWIGPEFYANRLLDWRLRDGRLESMEGRGIKPMRTVHLLTYYLDSEDGNLEMSIRTGAIESGDSLREDTWAGFLIGAGGPDVDFRISVLVHHWPAPGGGLVVGIDGTGAITVRDNENPEAGRGPRRDFTTADWPAFSPEERTGTADASSDVRLSVRATPAESGYDLVVTASDPESGETLSVAGYNGLDDKYFDGTLALVSHGSRVENGPGYWFKDWRVSGSKVKHDPDRAFGPVMGTQYTLSGGTLKLTAQMGPVGMDDTEFVELQIRQGRSWETVARGDIDPNAYTVPFRVDGWVLDGDVDYRVVYDLKTGGSTELHIFPGVIRTHPESDSSFVLAAFTGQNVSGGDGSWTHNHIWYPHAEMARAVRFHNPDMLFFSGDQIYEGGIAGVIREPADEAILDYLYHWYRFVWAFRDLMRDRPTVTIPDDHDVYHGNIWGEGGKSTAGPYSPFSDNGGYRMDPAFVNVVHRTQTSHLPDPFDASPIEQDISVYYTDLTYGGVSFAVIADRMWKSAPRALLPEAQVVNGWPQNPDFDAAAQSDVPDAKLLGERQLTFLDGWVQDWDDGAWMKVLLSQTLFSNVATIPRDATSGSVLPGLPLPEPGERITTDRKAADMDSGSWPQSGRNRALRIMRRGLAFHVAGDQHLGSVVQYGIDEWNDAPYALIVPSIANIWPRRWFPPTEGRNRKPDASWYTGEYFDGFGNRMTVHAAANPVQSGHEPSALYDRTPGYGIVRMNRNTREVVFEAWPRWIDPADENASQYTDWPVVFSQFDNDGRRPEAYLPRILSKIAEPVVSVTNISTNEHLYAVRIVGTDFRPKVFDIEGVYRVVVKGRDGGERVFEDVMVTSDEEAVLRVDF